MDDSQTTDYAYAFDGGKVWASCFGRPWFNPRNPKAEHIPEGVGKPVVFPSMVSRRAIATPGSPRSGMMVFRVG